MLSTVIDRRQGLGWLAAGLAVAVVPGLRPNRAAGARAGPLFVSARGGERGRYFVSGFDRQGSPAFDLALPGRGHAAVLRPGRRHAVVFARRPGSFALVIDLDAGQVLQRLDASDGRHFYGHGVFSQDGRTLFSTENDYEAGRGVIGIRDATEGYRRVGEYPSYEIGPHDIGLLADGKTLVVANGGVLTHPDSGRAKLNIPEMSPSLAYIDVADGALRADYRLPASHHKLSIRHLALGPGDEVGLALQSEAPPGTLLPLVGRHGGGEEIDLPPVPPKTLRRMRGYCGSAAFDRGGEILGVSCPRGNLVTFWHLGERRFLGEVGVADGCGIAATAKPGVFLISGGAGDLCLYDVIAGQKQTMVASSFTGARWDNHLAVVL